MAIRNYLFAPFYKVFDLLANVFLFVTVSGKRLKNVENVEKSDVYNKPQTEQKIWSYKGEDLWGHYYTEANGKHQSPINLNKCKAETNDELLNKPIELNYKPYFFKQLENNGGTFVVSSTNDDNSKVLEPSVKGVFITRQYRFLQFHMHWGPHDKIGSEHLVNGESYAAELHFVHWNFQKYKTPSEAMQSNAHDGLLVLGVFVKITNGEKEHSEMQKIIKYLKNIRLKGQSVEIKEPLNIEALFPKTLHKYWTYLGSLTTPPCTESVQWVVFNDPIEISSDQLNEFRNLYKCSDESECSSHTRLDYNYRQVCNLNNRNLIKSF